MSLPHNSDSGALDLERLLQAWPALAVGAAAILYVMGSVYSTSRSQTLGIELLNPTMPKEAYLLYGFSGVLVLVYSGGIGYLLWLALHAISRLGVRLPAIVSRLKRISQLPWLSVGLHVLLFSAWNALFNTIHAELGHLPARKTFPSALIAELFIADENSLAYGALLLVGICIWAWAFFEYYVYRRVSARSRRTFLIWHILTCAITLLMWGVLNGAVSTIDKYEVVGLQNERNIVGNSEALFLRLGSDDKEIALLAVILNPGGPKNWTKTMVFVPRADVKWIATHEPRPLYPLAFVSQLAQMYK